MMPIEVHTSDLTAGCLKSVKLRHEGKLMGESTTALYRGNVVGELLALAHQTGTWSRNDLLGLVQTAGNSIETRAIEENRPLSPSVREARTVIWAECVEAAFQYGGRIAPIIKKLIGVEVPVRMTLADLNGEATEFASHLDLIGRDANDRLVVWDWKWRDEAPSHEYLSRNLQLGAYWLAVRDGEIMLHGEWLAMEESPAVSWVDLPSLHVYKRKTTKTNPDGGTVEFKAGDTRPTDSIVREITFRNEKALRDELATRLSMMRAGLYPTNPTPGCRFCDSRMFCPSFTYMEQA